MGEEGFGSSGSPLIRRGGLEERGSNRSARARHESAPSFTSRPFRAEEMAALRARVQRWTARGPALDRGRGRAVGAVVAGPGSEVAGPGGAERNVARLQRRVSGTGRAVSAMCPRLLSSMHAVGPKRLRQYPCDSLARVRAQGAHVPSKGERSRARPPTRARSRALSRPPSGWYACSISVVAGRRRSAINGARGRAVVARTRRRPSPGAHFRLRRGACFLLGFGRYRSASSSGIGSSQ